MSECPPDDALKKYLLGTLSAVESMDCERHVETCELCQTTLGSIDLEGDDLVRAIRRMPTEAVTPVDDAYRDLEPIVRAIGQEWSSHRHKVSGTSPTITRIRDYDLVGNIGQGGMGTVHKAVHRRLQKVVALKLLPADRMEDSEAVRRFEREMQAVGKLDHPHIVRAMDAGEVDGTHYLVMEYVEGLNLSELVNRCGPLAIADACEIIIQAARGLQHAFEHGMVHRDIKPSNLILASSGIVKILDLGLARLNESQTAGGELTSPNQIMGTLDYMAPEQAADTHAVDVRADIYSLGATLYKLLSGEAPFSECGSRSSAAKLNAVLNTPPVPLQQRRSEVPEPLATLIAETLAKDPASRVGTPQEIVDALRPFMQGANLCRLIKRALGPEVPEASPVQDAASSVVVSSHHIDTDVLLQGGAAQVNRHTPETSQSAPAATSLNVDASHSRDDNPRATPLRAQPQESFRHRSRGLTMHGNFGSMGCSVVVVVAFLVAVGISYYVAWSGRSGPFNGTTPVAWDEALDRARALDERHEYAAAVQLCDRILTRQPENVDALLLRAQGQLALRQTDRASSDVEAAAALGADEARLLALRARIAVADRRFADADASYSAAIERNSADPHLLAERALVRAALGDHDAAIADFTAAVSRDPQAGWLYRWRSEEYFAAGRFQEALQDAQNAIRLEPDNPDYYLARGFYRSELGLLSEAASDFEKAIQLDDSAFARYLRGNLLAAENRFEEALADLAVAIEREPRESDYYLARAKIHLQQGNTQRAEADFNEALALGPDDLGVLQSRAGLHLARQDYDSAIDDLSEVIEQAPDSVSARRLRGIVYRDRGEHEKSLQDFRAAMEALSESNVVMTAELLYQQGLTFQAQENHEPAIAAFEQSLQTKPESASALFALSLSQGCLRLFDQSRASLDAAIEADPQNGRLYRTRADLQLAQLRHRQIADGVNPDESRRSVRSDYERALQIDPLDDAAWYSLAMLKMAAGEFEEALGDLSQAIELRPNDASYLQARGDLLASRQQYRSAIEDYTRAIAFRPKEPHLYSARALAHGELGQVDEAREDHAKAEQLARTMIGD